MPGKYIAKFYQKGDEDEIIRLTKKFSEKRITKEGWQWEYLHNPIKRNLFSVIMDVDKKKIIGTQALIPMYLSYKKQRILSAKSESTLLDTHYRGKGLLNTLYQLIYENIDHIESIWGVTRAIKAFKGVNFEVLGHIQGSFLPLSIFSSIRYFSNRFVKNNIKLKTISYLIGLVLVIILNMIIHTMNTVLRDNGKSNHGVKIVEQPYDTFDFTCFWQIFSNFMPDMITIQRNREFMRWWVFGNPYVEHKLFVIYQKEESVGYVIIGVDRDKKIACLRDIVMLALSKDEARVIIPWICNYLKDKGYSVLFNQIYKNGSHYVKEVIEPILGKRFIRFPGRTAVVFKNINSSDRCFLDFKNWYVTGLFHELNSI